jgi:hypothetical protein
MLNRLLGFDVVRRLQRVNCGDSALPPKAEVAIRRYETVREDARQYTVQLIQFCALFVTVIGAIIGLSLQSAVQWRTAVFSETYRDLIKIEADSRKGIFGTGHFVLTEGLQAELASEAHGVYRETLNELSFTQLVISPAIAVIISLAAMVSSIVICTAASLYAQIAIRRHEARLLVDELATMGFEDVLDHRTSIYPFWFAFHHFVAVVLLVDMMVLFVICSHFTVSADGLEGLAVPLALALAVSSLFAATLFTHRTLCTTHLMNVRPQNQSTATRGKHWGNWCYLWSMAFLVLSCILELILIGRFWLHGASAQAIVMAGSLVAFDVLSYWAISSAIPIQRPNGPHSGS